jgi:hypothetical protein
VKIFEPLGSLATRFQDEVPSLWSEPTFTTLPLQKEPKEFLAAVNASTSDLFYEFATQPDLTAWLAFSHRARLLFEVFTIDGGFIAGGCFKDWRRGNNPKDIDIFFPHEEAFNSAVARFEKSSIPQLYANENCMAFGWDSLRFELIRTRFGDPIAILDGFDFTIVQSAIAYQTDEFVLIESSNFRPHLDRKLVVFNPKTAFGTQQPLERLVRYHDYKFTVEQETLYKGFQIACSQRNCSEPVISLPKDFFDQWRLFASTGTLDHRTGTEASFGTNHILRENAVHEVGHILQEYMSGRAYNKNAKELVKQRFAQFDTRISEKSLLWQASELQVIPPLVRLSELLPKVASELEPAGRRALLALLFSRSASCDGSWWATADILTSLCERAIATKEIPLLKRFLMELFAHPAPPLNYDEWKTYLNSDAFSFNVIVDFYGALYGDPDRKNDQESAWTFSKNFAKRNLVN